VENSGLMIADGEGEERDLSLYTFVAVPTLLQRPDWDQRLVCREQGRLRYPRTYPTPNATTHSACFGDWRTLETPSLVNSLNWR
jgi:hypothetical protein